MSTITNKADISEIAEIAARFSLDKLNTIQTDTLTNLLAGRNVFLSVKTGAGKSLCYQAFPTA